MWALPARIVKVAADLAKWAPFVVCALHARVVRRLAGRRWRRAVVEVAALPVFARAAAALLTP